MLNLSYEDSLHLLQNTEYTVELTVSQIFSSITMHQQHRYSHHDDLVENQYVRVVKSEPREVVSSQADEYEVVNERRRGNQRNANRSERNRKCRSVTQISGNNCATGSSVLMEDQSENYLSSDYLNEYQASVNHERSYSHDEKFGSGNKTIKSHRSFEDSYLLTARSMPDLPKVNM